MISKLLILLLPSLLAGPTQTLSDYDFSIQFGKKYPPKWKVSRKSGHECEVSTDLGKALSNVQSYLKLGMWSLKVEDCSPHEVSMHIVSRSGEPIRDDLAAEKSFATALEAEGLESIGSNRYRLR